jgi:hypothetical protein
MSPTAKPRFGLILGLPLAAGLVVAGTCCTGETPVPQPTAGDVLQAQDTPKPAPNLTAADLLGGADEVKRVEFKLPELPFEERSEGLPKSGTWRGRPLLHDFTGDGLADIVVSNREEDGYNAWEATKAGPWVLRIQGLEPRNMAYGPSRAADMNEDGKVDLVLSAHTDALHVYFQDGKMNWTRSTEPIENPTLMIDVAPGNLNGDPHKDVVGIAHFEGGISVYLGDGKGGLLRLKESGSLVPREVMGKIIELADVNADGIDDIAVTTNAGLKVFLTRPGEPMKWEEVSRGLPNPKIGNSISGMDVAQMIPGGWPEVVMGLLCDPGDKGEDRNGIGVYAYDEKKGEWAHADTGLNREWSYRDIDVGDLNKDGVMDIVAMTPEGGGVIYVGTGNGNYKALGRLAGVHGKCMCTLGDADGDGFLDVLVSTGAQKENPERGSLRVFINRPAVWKP